MRIITGSKRGMKLLGPKGMNTRPITDRVKESLFDVLYKYDLIEGGRTADLFCGTGSMGLEAISRGAAGAAFIDKDRSAIEILKKNITKANFTAESKIICADAFKVGAAGTLEHGLYDLVFVDPPYAASTDTAVDSPLGRLLVLLCSQIKEHAIVAVRTSEKVSLLDEYHRLKVIDRRKWGSMSVSLLRMESPLDKGQPND